MNHWRDPEFRYIPASAHADSQAFRRRQQGRLREAQAIAVEAKKKVAPIAKRKATA